MRILELDARAQEHKDEAKKIQQARTTLFQAFNDFDPAQTTIDRDWRLKYMKKDKP
jgi:hypothetical protein